MTDEQFTRLLNDGGFHSPNIGFMADTVLTPMQVKTWMSARYPRPAYDKGYGCKQWFCLHADYNNILMMASDLERQGISTFIAMQKDKRGCETVWQPFHTDILYVYSTLDEVRRYSDAHLTTASYSDMENFILLTGMADPYTILVNPAKCRILSDTLVEVSEGPYAGIRGRACRCFGQQRLLVRNGDHLFATGYVPTGIMRKIES